MPGYFGFEWDCARSRTARISRRALASAAMACVLAAAAPVSAQEKTEGYKPTVGQMGKDSVWVPTPDSLIEHMLDLAKVSDKDLLIDLGSGDGRIPIAAGKRGARAIGVEWDEKLVALSDEAAKTAGVADKVEFVRHDMFTYDISKATVMGLFMLPDQMQKLTPKFLSLKPGSRIVINTFRIPGWEPDVIERTDSCRQWCTALLYFVPENVEGTWSLGDGKLTLRQDFQMLTGTLDRGGKSEKIEGRMRGTEITFKAGETTFTGSAEKNVLSGEMKGAQSGSWKATR